MKKASSNFHFFFLLIILTVASVNCYSQSHFLDTIKKCLKSKPTGEIWLDGRNSFLTGSKAPISGFKLGLDYDSKFSMGLGWQWITDNRGSNTYDKKVLGIDTLFRKTRLRYLTIYAEYVFYKYNRWEFSIMPQIGIGNTHYSYYKLTNEFSYKGINTPVIIYEPIMTGSFRLFKYFGLCGSLGFRGAFKNKKVVTDFLSSPVYSFGISIYWWSLYKRYVRGKKIFGKEITY